MATRVVTFSAVISWRNCILRSIPGLVSSSCRRLPGLAFLPLL